MHLLYSPIMIISSLLYFIWSLLIFPFSYVFLILKWMKTAFQRINKEFWSSLLNLLICSASGIPVMLLIILKDTLFFSLNLYSTNLKLKYIPEEDEALFSKLDPYFIKVFIQILEQIDHENKQKVESTEIIKQVRNELKVEQKIFELLFCSDRIDNVIFFLIIYVFIVWGKKVYS